jgi:hypothetical protein
MEIPKISDARLRKLSKQIRPVSRFAEVKSKGKTNIEPHNDGDLWFLKPVHPRKQAFTWDEQPDKRADKLLDKPIAEIRTLHGYGYHGLFKASVAEVLSQIPKEHIKECFGFETEYVGFSDDNKYHVAVTKLYGKKK